MTTGIGGHPRPRGDERIVRKGLEGLLLSGIFRLYLHPSEPTNSHGHNVGERERKKRRREYGR